MESEDEDSGSDEDARLYLYAHDVEPNTMQDVVDEMGLQGNVHLTGRLQVSCHPRSLAHPPPPPPPLPGNCSHKGD